MSTDQVFYSGTPGVFWVACTPVMSEKPQASPEILAANERLLALRQKHTYTLPVSGASHGNSDELQGWHGVSDLPDHLGWGSAALTAVLRRSQKAVSDENPRCNRTADLVDVVASGLPMEQPAQDGNSPDNPYLSRDSVKLYPDIGLAMLRQEKDAAGRLWLMLRCLDPSGQGSVRIDLISQQLSAKTSNLYLCGKRQLRNLLRAGEGVYWTRDKEQVWLRSAVRVAAALGVERLTGRPVALSVSALLGGIGVFRAHLYAAFHSGRMKGMGNGRSVMGNTGRTMPIARDTLSRLSGVGRSSQRTYEARLGLRVQPNFAIGEAEAAGRQEEQAWRQGQALFALKDHAGQQGQQGKTYLAWQLPNSYTGQHPQRPKGRQKRINRQLQDLVMKGMPGNEREKAERRGPAAAVATGKRYFVNGRLAVQALHSASAPRYWRRPSVGNGRAAIWHPVAQP